MTAKSLEPVVYGGETCSGVQITTFQRVNMLFSPSYPGARLLMGIFLSSQLPMSINFSQGGGKEIF